MSDIMMFAEGLLTREQAIAEFGLPQELEGRVFSLLQPRIGDLFLKKDVNAALEEVLGVNRPSLAQAEFLKGEEAFKVSGISQAVERRRSVPLLTTKEAAERLAIGVRNLQYQVSQGNITCVRFGKNCVRFAHEDLDDFVRRHRTTGSGS